MAALGRSRIGRRLGLIRVTDSWLYAVSAAAYGLAVDPSQLVARRATLDDLPTLKGLWATNGLPVLECERHLTEFQVIERPDGVVIGTVALRIAGANALLYGEAYHPGPSMDQARPPAWHRILALVRNQSVGRVWLRGSIRADSYWASVGFHSPTAAEIKLRPGMFGPSEGPWFVCVIFDEKLLEGEVKKEILAFQEESRRTNERLAIQALWFKRIAGFIAVGFLGATAYLLYKILSARGRRR